ncbi:MAG: radical SAM protein [Anaerolineales bacterium]|nr:radical SAM protein [Anaerolineales bacterium]
MMKYVFGPVPSRRLGQSLGVDPIPLKTCNWNCVYCQLGRTVPLTNVRREYIPREDILAEITEALSDQPPDRIDWVTFVGSGEPTLHSGLGWLVQQVKQLSDRPVAVITNGSLLYLPDVRHDLALADAVLPSLDAGSARAYRHINRPHPDISFERLVDGLAAFSQEYSGHFWLEVMLMQGINDTEEALQSLAAVLRRIQPEEIHLNLPTRPPAESRIRPSDEEGLMRALAILGDTAKVVHSAAGSFDLGGCDNVVDAIINIITRHPMRQEELEGALAEVPLAQVSDVLAALEAGGRAQVIERYGTRFWSAAAACYPADRQLSRR